MNGYNPLVRSFFLGALVIAALSLIRPTSPPVAGQSNSVAITSAASFAATVAPDSIAAIFGPGLAPRTESATPGQPLPAELAGTSVTIGGLPAPLFFVAETQVNCLVPPALAPGRHAVVVRSGSGTLLQGEAQVAPAAPGIFTLDTSGKGRPVAQLLRVRNNNLIYENIGTAPIEFGPENEPAFLLLYLTGLRRAAGNARVLLGNNDMRGDAAAVGGLAGLDQISAPIPRSLLGRGQINVSVVVPGLAFSNEVLIEIAGSGGSGAPQIVGFDNPAASAGDVMVITGSNFNPERAKNIVRIGGIEATVLEAESGRLRVRVPFGAASSQVSVINERGENDRREGRSSAVLQIKTSLSGFIEDTRRQPLRDVTIRLRGTTLPPLKTSAEGLFSFRDLPNLGNSVELEIDPSGTQQLGSLPFPRLVMKKSFRTGRDNYIERIPLQQESGPSIQVGAPPSFGPDAQGGFARQIATGGVVLDVQTDTPAQFPDGATSGRITMTIVADSRTPIALPPSEYSSSVVQLTPFTTKLQRGAKLTFPNPERFPAGTQARLYRLETPADQATSFVEVGRAQVSADGQRIETVAGAIDTLSYYFVSLPRRSTVVTGQVIDSDRRTPIRGALVSARGQTTLSDGTGSFILRSVLVNEGDVIAVDAGYLRPNGRVDRGQIVNINAVIDGVTALPAPLVLTSQEGNRLPIVLAPDSLIISEGEQKEVLLIAAHPDGGEIVRLEISGANFASLRNNGAGLYTLRLTPGPNSLGKYTLRLIATDNFGQTVSPEITLFVNGRPMARPDTVITGQNQPVNFTLSGEDPEGYALEYIIVENTRNGSLTRLGNGSPVFTYTPNASFLGSDQLLFKVNDALADSAPARVTLLVNQVNRPPVLSVPGPQSATVGNPLTFNVTASDPDANQSLVISATNRPGGSSFTQTSNSSAQFSWTPTAAQVGNHTVTFEVSDNGTPAYKDTKTVTITVSAGGNQPPVANAQTVITNEDTPVNLTLSASDPDGNALSYSIVSNPANGTLNGSGANRRYTPSLNFNGTDSFSFRVNDGALDSNVATVTITVNPVNDAPVLAVPGAQSVTAGQTLSFNLTASDVDVGQSLTLSAQNLPAGASFTQTAAASGQFSWTPSAAQAGNYTVTFQATDNGTPALSDSKTVNLTVNAPANPVPALTSLNPSAATAGSAGFALTVNGSNFINGSVVRWQGSDRPTTFVSSTRLTAQVLAADLANAGSASVTVFNPAPSGGGSNSLTFTINPPACPTITINPASLPNAEVGQSYQALLSQAGGNGAITWSVSAGALPVGLALNLQTGVIAGTPTVAGTAILTIRATDANGCFGTRAYSLTVNASCSYTIQPTSQSFGAGGGTGTISVTSASGCAWTAVSNAGWLAISSGANGSGNGTVSYSVAANTAASRSGTLTIAGRTFTVTQASGSGVRSVAVVSAASFSANNGIAAESMAASFGINLATATVMATTTPLPTTLGGTTVKVRDSAGTERLAGINLVSPGQVNFVVPAGTVNGTATVTITSGDGSISIGTVSIATVAPGLFAKNGDGQGIADGVALRVKSNGTQSFEELSQFDQSSGRFVARPIDPGPEGERVFLILYGTGLRARSSLSAVTLKIGGVESPILFAGSQGSLPGYDQINAELPRNLAGRGEVDVVLTVDGKTANTVRVAIGGTLPTITVTPINFDQSIDGELTNSDQVQMSNNNSYFFDAYRFTTTQANTTVAIDLRSRGTTSLDPALLLYRLSNNQLSLVGADDQTGGYGNGAVANNNALLLTVLPTVGDYVIFATSANVQPNGTGTYTLRLRQNVLQSISYGANLTNAAISSSDLQTSAGTYLDAYWFTAAANDQVNITLTSSAFDAFLILQANSGGAPVAFDDNSGGGFNAQITRQLETAGIYIILATPYEVSRTGAYTLSLTRTASLSSVSKFLGLLSAIFSWRGVMG